jgi:hypothetical protein
MWVSFKSNLSGSGDDMTHNLDNDNKSNHSVKRTISRTRTTSTSEKDGTIHIRGSKTIYTAGRPPWYDSSGQMKEALVIGINIYIKCCKTKFNDSILIL